MSKGGRSRLELMDQRRHGRGKGSGNYLLTHGVKAPHQWQINLNLQRSSFVGYSIMCKYIYIHTYISVYLNEVNIWVATSTVKNYGQTMVPGWKTLGNKFDLRVGQDIKYDLAQRPTWQRNFFWGIVHRCLLVSVP